MTNTKLSGKHFKKFKKPDSIKTKMAKKMIKTVLKAGKQFARTTKAKIEQEVKTLIGAGILDPTEARKLLATIIKEAKEEKKRFETFLKQEAKRTVKKAKPLAKELKKRLKKARTARKKKKA